MRARSCVSCELVSAFQSRSSETTHVTEQRQAVIAADALQTVATEGNVGAFVWYSGQDLGDDLSSNLDFYGLRRRDGSEKPAYGEFAATMDRLGLSVRR